MKKVLTLAATLLSLATLFAAAEPLNILVLPADDWHQSTLGCAGSPA